MEVSEFLNSTNRLIMAWVKKYAVLFSFSELNCLHFEIEIVFVDLTDERRGKTSLLYNYESEDHNLLYDPYVWLLLHFALYLHLSLCITSITLFVPPISVYHVSNPEYTPWTHIFKNILEPFTKERGQKCFFRLVHEVTLESILSLRIKSDRSYV